MKKSLILILLMSLLLLCAGCGPEEPAPAPAPAEQPPAEEPAPTEPGEVEPEFEMTLGEVNPAGHPQSLAYYWMADRVAELTNGRVKINIYTDSVLGSTTECVEGLGFGSVQITKSMTTTLTGLIPELAVFDLPYLMSSYEHFENVFTNDEITDHYGSMLAEHDLQLMCWFYGGARSFYTNDPITKLSDMNGWTIRVPESTIYMDMCSAFGASGTPIPLGDLYSALQTGVVDGAENAPIIWESCKHYEVAKYLTLDEHIMTPDVVLMSKTYLESLPQDIQDILVQVMWEMQDYECQLWLDMEQETIDKLLAEGAVISEIDKTEFQEAAQVVWEKYYDIVGRDWVEKIQSLAP